MLKRLLFGAGAAYLARKFMGGNRRSSRDYDRRGGGGLFGSFRNSRRGTSW